MFRSTELSQQVEAEALEVEQKTNLTILLSIALLMLFVLLNYLVINRSVLRSISALQSGAERIRSGDLDTKIETFSNDELGYLSLEFNEMTSSLNNTRNLLLASNVELERKNQELMAANEHLATAEKELKIQFDALAESEGKFRGIFDHINDGLQIHEIETDGKPGKFIEINEVACRMLQYSREELLNYGPLHFVTGYHSRPLKDIVRELSSTGHAIFETEHRRKDGTIIPVEINSHVVTLQGERVMVGVVRDISDRKLAEGILLRVNQKLNVLSQLTRKDLTNQFFILSSYLEMAINQLAGQDRIIETVEKGIQAVRQIHKTIEYSKDYQDMGAKPPKWQNVKMTLLFGLSHISIGKIQHSLETEDLEIFADPLLEKVCQRLFENSVKHGGHVTRIRVWHTVTPDGATIVFEDDGIGIPNEMKEQIFLREEGSRASRGSLIFVREILDITGITIRETGEPGKGARFEIVVPKGMWRSTGNDT
jgi:PAS domain S-box-containing protein